MAQVTIRLPNPPQHWRTTLFVVATAGAAAAVQYVQTGGLSWKECAAAAASGQGSAIWSRTPRTARPRRSWPGWFNPWSWLDWPRVDPPPTRPRQMQGNEGGGGFWAWLLGGPDRRGFGGGRHGRRCLGGTRHTGGQRTKERLAGFAA